MTERSETTGRGWVEWLMWSGISSSTLSSFFFFVFGRRSLFLGCGVMEFFFFFFFLFKKIGNSEGAPGLGSKLESSARGVGKLRERKSERDYYEILSLGVQDGKVDREDKGWNLGDRKS